MPALINARCFLCSTEPCHHGLRVIHPEKGTEDDVTICDSCFSITCYGVDNEVARLWFALQEAESSGYTDAGFLHDLKRSVASFFHGSVALAWVKWNTEDGTELEGAFLMASVPNPVMGGLPPIWCRSKTPLHASLVKVACDQLPQYEVPMGTTWVDGIFLVAQIPEDSGMVLKVETNNSVAHAVVAQYKKAFGERSPFRILANNMTKTGYELIRRYLL